MEFVRTPAEQFENLSEYNFRENFLMTSDGLRMHYLDEGMGDETIMLLHGEPSWSYLYRKMIPVLVKAGIRVLAPDLIGFGKSDKPKSREDYSYQNHFNWLKSFVDHLQLSDFSLFLQDWGGLLGLRLVDPFGDYIKRMILANTFLPTGNIPASKAFLKWKEFSQKTPDFNVGAIINMATTTNLDSEVISAYDAPFPDDSFKAGAREFPALVPIDFDDPESAENRRITELLKQFDKPVLTLFSDQDPIMRGGDIYFQQLIPGTKGMPHDTIRDAGHFLQEDKGEEIAEKVAAFIRKF